MLTLVVGGAASGKSAFAEELVLRSARRPRVYVATMEPFDRECLERIRRHRELRARKEFETVECYTGLLEWTPPAGCVALLECMSNLCANELYSSRGSGDGAEAAILSGVDRLCSRCGELVVVSNEVFSGGRCYQGDTLRYLHLLARVNRALAARAEWVWEVACGIPVAQKGGGGHAL